MKFALKRFTATTLLALATGPLLMLSSLSAHADTTDAALAGAVESALTTQLGTEAKDVTASADNGTVTLHGWTQLPRQEAKARAVASKVPGVGNVYSHVRVFSSKD